MHRSCRCSSRRATRSGASAGVSRTWWPRTTPTWRSSCSTTDHWIAPPTSCATSPTTASNWWPGCRFPRVGRARTGPVISSPRWPPGSCCASSTPTPWSSPAPSRRRRACSRRNEPAWCRCFLAATPTRSAPTCCCRWSPTPSWLCSRCRSSTTPGRPDWRWRSGRSC